MRDKSLPVLPQNPALQLDANKLAELERRQRVIIPLAESYRPAASETIAAASELGLSVRTVHLLIQRYRESKNDPLSLLRATPGRPKGFSRLPSDTENIIADALAKMFLKSQKPNLAVVYRHIRTACRQRGLTPPSLNTVKKRRDALAPHLVHQRRNGANAARALKPVAGEQMPADFPLHVIQMDHTLVDVILVDPVHRQDIGRPYLTLAIDLFSRCIAGYALSLDPPSATSVGLCLTHVATPKGPLLLQHGVEAEWPLAGKPRILHTDNAREFDSQALRRGCVAHGIDLRHRPVARPWFGGTIERVIGTFMRKVHELPGATFSNVQMRGTYPSQDRASLTLAELEHWLLHAIVGYHAEIHSSLGETPQSRLEYGLREFGAPPQAVNLKTYLIDFLPIVHRRLGRGGFQIDNITYYTPNLDRLIERREQQLHTYEIRRDPRNLRFIWVVLPDGEGYLEVPYRNLRNPDISLWEHKHATRKLLSDGRGRVNEDLIVQTVLAQREIIREASRKSRQARRRSSRAAANHQLVGTALPPITPRVPSVETGPIPVFTDLDVDL